MTAPTRSHLERDRNYRPAVPPPVRDGGAVRPPPAPVPSVPGSLVRAQVTPGGRLSAGDALRLQRTVGNRATTALLRRIVVQRDSFDTWHATATGPGKRDPALATLDQRVEQVLNENDDGKLVYRLRTVSDALDDLTQRGYKKFAAEREALHVRTLQRTRAALDRIGADVTKTADFAAQSTFATVGGPGKKYAGRQMESGALAGWDAPANGIKDFLSRPRGPGGGLSGATVAAWILKAQADIQAAIARFQTGGVGTSGVTANEAYTFLTQFGADPVTGREDPEGAQYGGLAPDISNQAGNEVTVAQNLSGTNVNITYNTTDPTWNERVVALDRAIARLAPVVTAGVPGLNLYLPKFAKAVSKGAGGHTQVHDVGNRAEFMFPDTMFLSPSMMIPSVTTSISYEETQKAVRQHKLAALEGVATCVHELAHFLHYHKSPGNFLGLTLTSIVGHTKKGVLYKTHVEQKVSQYGGGNPRELVAEVLTGITFGRKYDKDIMAMYHAFGGPDLA